MRRRRGRIGTIPAALLVLALVAAGVYMAFAKELPFRGHYEVSAVFRSANGVKPGSPVRIAGVDVGKVTAVDFVENGQAAARVTMRIDDKGLPLHRDARFAIRPRIFLEGNFFVDVQPGSPSAPSIEDGATIPIQQTKTPVQLDQILTTLQASTREDLQRLLQAYAGALGEEGARGISRSIPWWEPAYRDASIVNDALLGEVEGDLRGYVRNAGAMAEALDRNGEQLKDLITDFNTTAHAFASEQDELSSAIAELPRTLRTAYPALGALNRALPPVRTLVAALRPAVRSSGPAIDAGLPLVGELRSLVSAAELRGLSADLRPTVPALARLQRASVPLYEQVRAASSCQNEVILPWTHDRIEDKAFPATGPVYQESTKPLPGLAGESRSGDANGQWFRVLAQPGLYSTEVGNGMKMLSQEPIMGANPPKPAGRPPLRPDVPCETQEPPDLRTRVDTSAKSHAVEISDSPDVQRRLREAQERAVTWLERTIEDHRLGGVLEASNAPITRDLLPKLRELGVTKP